jgi:cytidyltransferase-like protein
MEDILLKKKSVLFAHELSEKLNSEGLAIWLAYGSSLGAVREGKVIEGDKDMDLMMWEEDYKKFKTMVCGGDFPNFPAFQWDFREMANGGEVCKITLGDKSLPKGENIPMHENRDPDDKFCVSCGANLFYPRRLPVISLLDTTLCKACEEYTNTGFHIDIFSLRKLPDGVRCAIQRSSEKLYHYQILKKIKFENLDFYVPKHVEKTLDFLYSEGDNTWRTPHEMHARPHVPRIEEITGCVMGVFDLFHIGHLRLLERSRKIFDKVVAAVHSDEVVMEYKKVKPVIPYEHRVEIVNSCKYVDEVIEAPLRPQTVEFLDKNNLDYLVHGKTEPKFLKEHYSEIINENRLLLLNETEDYHTTDLRKRINS